LAYYSIFLLEIITKKENKYNPFPFYFLSLKFRLYLLYFRHFGYPLFEVKLKNINGEIPIIRDVKTIVESSCGATNVSLEHVRGKPLTPETITAFGLNVRYECREPVSTLLSHRDMADSSALLQMISLLDALEKAAPKHFLPGTPMGIYTSKRREEYQCPNPKSDLFAEIE